MMYPNKNIQTLLITHHRGCFFTGVTLFNKRPFRQVKDKRGTHCNRKTYSKEP
jgi:hypothetical protein